MSQTEKMAMVVVLVDDTLLLFERKNFEQKGGGAYIPLFSSIEDKEPEKVARDSLRMLAGLSEPKEFFNYKVVNSMRAGIEQELHVYVAKYSFPVPLRIVSEYSGTYFAKAEELDEINLYSNKLRSMLKDVLESV